MNRTKKISKELAKQMVIELTSSGEIFSAEFIKKDGTLRTMNCQRGVKKHLTGKGASYDPASKNIVFVYDNIKRAYRSLPLDRLTKVCINKQRYVVA